MFYLDVITDYTFPPPYFPPPSLPLCFTLPPPSLPPPPPLRTPLFRSEDAAALEVLLSFHTVAAGTYPLSLTGAHFSQQLYRVDPSGGSLSRDYYRDFYAASFEGGQVTTLGRYASTCSGPNIAARFVRVVWRGAGRPGFRFFFFIRRGYGGVYMLCAGRG